MSKIDVNIITSQNINFSIADTSEQLVKEINNYKNIKINVIPITNIQSKNPFYFIKLLKGIKKKSDNPYTISTSPIWPLTNTPYRTELYNLNFSSSDISVDNYIHICKWYMWKPVRCHQ